MTARYSYVLLLLAALPSAAGTLDVNGTAAAEGNFGLEVTPGSSCVGPETLELDGEIVASDRTACSYLKAVDTTFAGDLDLTAGIALQFDDGTKFGDGGSVSLSIDDTLTRLAYLIDRRPNGETTYNATFQLRLDDADIPNGDQFVHFSGHSSEGTRPFEVRLKRSPLPAPGENRLSLAAREDDGGVVVTDEVAEVMIPAGFHTVGIQWVAAAGSGSLSVSLDGISFGGLVGLDNGLARIDSVRWGVVDGEVEPITGSLDIDDFSSTR